MRDVRICTQRRNEKESQFPSYFYGLNICLCIYTVLRGFDPIGTTASSQYKVEPYIRTMPL